MLVFNFTRIFKARGVERIFSYVREIGYSDNFATKVAHNRFDKLNLKQIEKFCVILKCTPNDLLEWIPDANEQNVENHPLYPLKRSDKVLKLTQMLNSIPLDKLAAIENMIKNEIEK